MISQEQLFFLSRRLTNDRYHPHAELHLFFNVSGILYAGIEVHQSTSHHRETCTTILEGLNDTEQFKAVEKLVEIYNDSWAEVLKCQAK